MRVSAALRSGIALVALAGCDELNRGQDVRVLDPRARVLRRRDAASVGLVLCVPITTAIAVYFAGRRAL